MVIFFYGFCRMDKVYTYSVHWGGIVHIQERVNCPQWMGNLPILQIYPILQNSSMLQIRSHRKFIHIAKFIHVANSPMFSIAFKGRANCPQRKGELPSKEGRIADNGWANCNSPLHVCYPNVGKYYMQIASRAWHRFFCVRRRGELKFAHTAICPYCKFIPYCKIHPRCKIHPHYNSPTPQFASIAPLKL